jgi:outer membrane receptor for ferrienterochelin and colicins
MTGERLPDRSRHAANATLAWTPLENLTTSLRVNYVGSQDYVESIRGVDVRGKRPAYTMVSVYGDYAFNEHTTLQFGVENITDVRLADENGEYAFADEGLRYFLGLTAKF